MIRWFPWLSLLLLAGCEEGADGQPFVDLGDPQDWIDPTEYHLAATTTAAWIGAIASEHWASGSHPCAEEQTDGSLVLTPGPDCPHPLLDSLEGTATVAPPTGTGDQGFAASAADLSSGGRSLLVSEYSAIQAAPDGTGLTIAMTTTDYGEIVWPFAIQVDTAGTPETGDDRIDIDGLATAPEPLPDRWKSGDNEVGMTSSLTVTPGCRRNPTSGSVIMEGHTDWPLLEIQAHPGCDGKVHIDSTEQEKEWTPTLDLLAGQ